ncbi:hypothetical protein HYH02_003796 [Chlamydomonas schloesseri]|uniref:Oxidation resistance protein 1 n=1 Tax=Chlamydomonas schloesseri TaxID=2026947 RepID=A0A835WPU4_9CHLO|nr:hypothetical protein HYH02_003796 [Chlamydomonas schloesseri]|eukprot:KAG2451189.1 hypothetical protein HYH02_003796 [Chlamydomonas schloesseri]
MNGTVTLNETGFGTAALLTDNPIGSAPSPGDVLPIQVQLVGLVALGVCALAFVTQLSLFVARLVRATSIFNYVAFCHDSKDILIVDCTHPHAKTLSHHKNVRNPKGLRAADTSTGLVLNAIKAGPWSAGQPYEWCQLPRVSTNHFDVDSFLSVWCYINRPLALQHEAVLRHMARIGDFREAFLSPELVSRHGSEDGIVNIRDAFTALKLVCWLNSVERNRFSAPYEAKDCDAKFAFFLPRFAAVLANPESVWQEWQDEYKEVVSGFDVLTGEPPSVERHKSVGLAVLRAPEPSLHYYALFSHTVGYDTVLTMYDNHRYEVESKYTQFVTTHSRPVWPRIDMAPLARVLNRMDAGVLDPQYQWSTSRFTDTGPVLRIEDSARPLSKAQRYGHPAARPLHASGVPPPVMVALVMSFLEYGMQGLKPKRGGWSWDELQSLNAGIPWQTWEDTVVAQWQRGELDPSNPTPHHPNGTAATNGHRHHNQPHSHAHSHAPPPPGSHHLSSQPSSGGALPPLYSPASSFSGPAGAAATTLGGSRQGSLTATTSLGAVAVAGGGPALLPRVGAAMTAGGVFWEPVLSEPSAIMSMDDVRALSSAVPARLAQSKWALLYGSSRDGISLRTLYRKAAGRAPTLLVVREAGGMGHIFGAFAAEAWKPGPRFYGTGETFVFTLQPQRVKYAWQRPRQGTGGGAAGAGGGGGGMYSRISGGGGGGVVGGGAPSPPGGGGAVPPLAAAAAAYHMPPAAAAAAAAGAGACGAGGAGGSSSMDFFQFSTHEGLGVGGQGAFALWLDNELVEGASYGCDTFASPQLSAREEFKVAAVELWQL